jgi:formamidopyrimidine-DNA glycosylase
VVGQTLRQVRIASPFVMRTFDPPIEQAEGKKILALRRLGKRIVLELEGDLFLVVHLMIAGRFRWNDDPAAKLPAKIGLATFRFDHGSLHLVESSTQKRASIHFVRGRESIAEHQPGGLEVMDADAPAFIAQLRAENHTLKRALTDPRLFSGIGNAYSDEILHTARLSPVKLTSALSDEEARQLFAATTQVLGEWTARLQKEFADRFPGPGDVTAFRPDFAVHGRYNLPCPVCGTKVQRIQYAENETNYCPRCQTGGKLLADRGLSRLLKADWPASIEELEAMSKAREGKG